MHYKKNSERTKNSSLEKMCTYADLEKIRLRKNVPLEKNQNLQKNSSLEKMCTYADLEKKLYLEKMQT